MRPGWTNVSWDQPQPQDAHIRDQMRAFSADHVPQARTSRGGCAHLKPSMASRCVHLGTHVRIFG
eukprot:11982451-Karenia_brevis.AAC.1